MESRISKILERLNEEDCKFKELKRNYITCKKIRELKNVELTAVKYKQKNVERFRLSLDGPIVEEILDVVEKYYIELGFDSKRKLEALVEEMKEGSENE